MVFPTFAAWAAMYNKVYNGDEFQREAIYNANIEFINAENAKGHSYTLGIGPFTDITGEEFKSHLGYTKPDTEEPDMGTHQWQGEELEDRIDWTEKGVVTEVKDQGQCGSCWAFSTTGAIESGYAISSGNLVSISEQQHVDCDGLPNLGCMGGNMGNALKWAMKKDSCTEKSYPYTAKGGILSSCKSAGCDVAIPAGTITGVKSMAGLIGKASDADMMSAVAQQPLSIAIEADQNIFQHYTGGVITGSCGTNTDHGVLLVGYGTDGGTEYWKVKNSWGPSWGDHGFVRMVRGQNICGINSGPNYPLFGSSVSV
jgi:C1A family cysteine protease